MTQSQIIDCLRRSFREVKQVQRAANRKDETEERYQHALARLEYELEVLMHADGTSCPIRGPVGGAPRPDLADEVLRAQAGQGAGSLGFDWQPDGSARIVIDDDGKELWFSPVLAMLLELLQAEGGTKTDHLVGWKPFDFLTRELTRLRGRPCTRNNLRTLVGRLRDGFVDAKANFYLIQTRRGYGYRVARRSGQCDRPR